MARELVLTNTVAPTLTTICGIQVLLGSRQVHIAGMTPHPNGAWMMQVARNVTIEEWGFLSSRQYLIHDRDGTY